MRKIYILFFIFILGFILGGFIKFIYEANTFKPYIWESPPVIINCYGEDFSKSQMIRAIDFWIIKGEDIAFYEHDPPSYTCDKEYINGFIILRKGRRFNHETSVLAVTSRWTSFTTVLSAVITYRPGTQNLQWINEHELGHALGYTHVEEDGHIMHPLFDKMQGKFWIP